MPAGQAPQDLGQARIPYLIRRRHQVTGYRGTNSPMEAGASRGAMGRGAQGSLSRGLDASLDRSDTRWAEGRQETRNPIADPGSPGGGIDRQGDDFPLADGRGAVRPLRSRQQGPHLSEGPVLPALSRDLIG